MLYDFCSFAHWLVFLGPVLYDVRCPWTYQLLSKGQNSYQIYIVVNMIQPQQARVVWYSWSSFGNLASALQHNSGTNFFVIKSCTKISSIHRPLMLPFLFSFLHKNNHPTRARSIEHEMNKDTRPNKKTSHRCRRSFFYKLQLRVLDVSVKDQFDELRLCSQLTSATLSACHRSNCIVWKTFFCFIWCQKVCSFCTLGTFSLQYRKTWKNSRLK